MYFINYKTIGSVDPKINILIYLLNLFHLHVSLIMYIIKYKTTFIDIWIFLRKKYIL